MSDFMKWLYANYIQPQVEDTPPGEYEMHLSLMTDELDDGLKVHYGKALEFTAIHAFSLGLRTGAGLREVLPVSPK